ncbi:unnamed protein product [Euphydryas editha]|uniref:CCHC-type domain-containing protein n=2 Tax=Euphydryas editha TaxID=104508 RepID=A0AAU9TEJ8_EUPED|nr:unnamed protein product [Euphydryas editha]
MQDDNETVADYIAVLKKMSTTCDFGGTLEENLRDQFVCGLRSESIRQRLFAEDDIDYKKAYRLATSLEAAEKNAASITGRVSTTTAGTGSVACHVVERIGSSTRSTGHKGKNVSGSGSRDGARTLRPQLGQAQLARRWERGPARAKSGPAAAERRQQPCTACGGPHSATTCSFSKYVCRVCNQKGHLRRVCPNLREHHSIHSSTAPADGNEDGETREDSDEVILNMNNVWNNHYKPIMIAIIVHNRLLHMECDTGSAVSCISYEIYNKHFRDLKLKPCKIVLRYYTGELVRPLGMITPLVKYKKRQENLDLYVIENGKSLLLGRQWLTQLGINVSFEETSAVHSLKPDIVFNLNEFSSRFYNVFSDGLGRFTGGTVSIRVREGARPVFLRARPLAYALRAPVERALDQMVSDGILTPVEHSDWATPIVPVLKKDGDIRICADYKLTLNKVLEVDRYPLPKVEDLLARLHGGQRFSKIDLSQAYAQFVLDESRKYTVINTHKGLFMYNRLVYGLASSPGIFQRRLEQLFSDLPYVGVFLDDVIITGRDNKEHLNNLNKVFERLQAHGLKVKKEKCSFFVESIHYLGHVIDKQGVHACPEKVKAIVGTPPPTNVSEVRAFLGLANYYGKFIKNASTILSPLYELLRKDVKFQWNSACDFAFNKVKELLVSSKVLAHYSLSLPLVLTVDASAVGVGAVISHVTATGERPIAFASRSLCTAERSYSQIEREALAIIF